MAFVEINCPACACPLEAEHFKDAYCKQCDVTYDADTDITDIYIGECAYSLTGRYVSGNHLNDI